MLLDCFFKSKENYLTNQKHIRIIVQYENLGDRMKIQLSKIISVPKYEETVEASIDLNEIKLKGVSYPIREKNDFSIVFRNIGKDKISFAFETEVTLGIPCSRCLEEVSYPVSVQVMKELDFSDLDEEDSSYIEDKYLDLDILIFDEVVPKLPSRVLCKEDCKGLCPVCGTNRSARPTGTMLPVRSRTITAISPASSTIRKRPKRCARHGRAEIRS